jgi:hypothetical protein
MSGPPLEGAPDDGTCAAALEALVAFGRGLGVEVANDEVDPNHARFVGLFEGHTITLYPRVSSSFARWFTVAHLYGHMVQLSRPTPELARANALILGQGQPLAAEDVQLVYDHEREAAEIGHAFAAAAGTVTPALDGPYTRYLFADFRYLIDVIETGRRGPEHFASFWRREPTPPERILSDPRPLVDLRVMEPPAGRVFVV